MPLHLEKVRDKLAENIHELWGMNKIELGWSYGKVSCMRTRWWKWKQILTLASMDILSVCGEMNITAARFFFCFFFSILKMMLEMRLFVSTFSPKTESSKACPSSCFLFYNLRFTPKTEGKWKDTHSSPPPHSCGSRESFPPVCSLSFSRSHGVKLFHWRAQQFLAIADKLPSIFQFAFSFWHLN